MISKWSVGSYSFVFDFWITIISMQTFLSAYFSSWNKSMHSKMVNYGIIWMVAVTETLWNLSLTQKIKNKSKRRFVAAYTYMINEMGDMIYINFGFLIIFGWDYQKFISTKIPSLSFSYRDLLSYNFFSTLCVAIYWQIESQLHRRFIHVPINWYMSFDTIITVIYFSESMNFVAKKRGKTWPMQLTKSG